MLLPDTDFRFRLERKINGAIEQATGQLCSGYADDFPNYRYRVGFIRALEQTLDLCAEVEREMNVPQKGA